VKRAIPLLAVLYPFVVVFALRWIEPRWIGLAIGAMVAIRAAASWRSVVPSKRMVLILLLLLLSLGFTWTRNDEVALLLAPVAINASLLVMFGSTLFGGPTFVETIARARTPNLPLDEVSYCRGVTKVWCAFFVANGSCCAVLALAADRWLWAAYTGLVAYALMGLLFTVEFAVRSKRFGRYRGSPLEPVLRMAFGPPRA
jgi:uncharacterized membrane protein